MINVGSKFSDVGLKVTKDMLVPSFEGQLGAFKLGEKSVACGPSIGDEVSTIWVIYPHCFESERFGFGGGRWRGMEEYGSMVRLQSR